MYEVRLKKFCNSCNSTLQFLMKMDDFEISHELLSNVIESKISKALNEKIIGLISE